MREKSLRERLALRKVKESEQLPPVPADLNKKPGTNSKNHFR